MHRRTFLATALGALTAQSTGIAAGREHRIPTSRTPRASHGAIAEFVRRRAKELANRDFEAVPEASTGALASMGYDEYRDLRFRPERSVWRGENRGFELQFFAAAYIYRAPVEIFLVENGRIRPIAAERSLFDFGLQSDRVPRDAALSFSGFRIHAPLKRPEYYDELMVFQGASYFRGLGRDHTYGLSARAVALNTEGPEAEEFPAFKSFWIERPEDHRSIIVHGLLDSPSLTGAYTFVIEPGARTGMQVDACLYPRRELSKIGLAPLTSMFLKDAHDSDGRLDFRPAIHDSDGLASWNGRDERLWRPLVSPRKVQVSYFEDSNPKGFGLIQRARSFEAYQDLEAHYQDRPSAWIEPVGDWGVGANMLVEIPTDVEYFDNIVSYWRPRAVLPAGQEFAYGYRLNWCDDVPAWKGHRVSSTRIGEGSRPGTVRFVVDFIDQRDTTLDRVASISVTDVPLRPLPDAQVSASVGLAGVPLVQRNPETGGVRATFEFDPHGQQESELRLALVADGSPASEVWLFRWQQ